jgi:hypothetical protein
MPSASVWMYAQLSSERITDFIQIRYSRADTKGHKTQKLKFFRKSLSILIKFQEIYGDLPLTYRYI